MADRPPGEVHRSFSRRQILLAGGGVLAGVAVARVLIPGPGETTAPGSLRALPSDPFTLGVASGDPLPDGVVLWTRLAPDPLAGGGMPSRPVSVEWQVSTDERFDGVVRQGMIDARAESAHSVHVEVGGLEPARWYWYRFRVGSHLSPAGRTRTAPAPDSSPTAFAFAFASCQDWQNGFFTAYRDMAGQDLDLVVHLGDYIYEAGPEGKTRPGAAPGRVHEGPEVSGLESYRNRYALYKSDPDLQAAHARFPWVVTRDDHEVESNYAGVIPEESTSPPGDFAIRRDNAYRAYYEHMPLRSSSQPAAPGSRLYRRLRFGDLVELNVLDTRQYRSDQACGDSFKSCEGRTDPGQTMTGADQERWLVDGLKASTARWNVIAQQTVFAQADLNAAPGSQGTAGLFNMDQWDGYAAQRRRLTDFLAGPDGPPNPVVVTGDLHSSWVNDIRLDYDDPASPTVATEFVGTSISSDFSTFIPIVTAALPDNPHVKYFDGTFRGYVVARIDRGQWRSDFRVVDTVDAPTSPARLSRSWTVDDGVPGAHPA